MFFFYTLCIASFSIQQINQINWSDNWHMRVFHNFFKLSIMFLKLFQTCLRHLESCFMTLVGVVTLRLGDRYVLKDRFKIFILLILLNSSQHHFFIPGRSQTSVSWVHTSISGTWISRLTCWKIFRLSTLLPTFWPWDVTETCSPQPS